MNGYIDGTGIEENGAIPTKTMSVINTSTSEFKNSRTYLSVAILILINLLNYMDRYTIAGVLTNIQSYYAINDAQGGLLQTTFMVFFMLCSPLCGFLGDRYVRKWIMVIGLTVWVMAVCASTFVPPHLFWLFLLFRGIVGIGEASYAVISPSIIADMFTGQNRSRTLMFFYFAIPCGSGLGFMAGSTISALTGDWKWGVRVTAILGVLCLVMIIVFIEEPERGGAEREKGEIANKVIPTSYFEDLKALAKKRKGTDIYDLQEQIETFTQRFKDLKSLTYVFSTAGYTAIIFVIGTMTWWAPTAIQHSDAMKLGLNDTDSQLNPAIKAQVNLIYGAITCVGGIAGVALGSTLSSCLRTGLGPFRLVQTVRSDAIVCATGALLAVPALFFCIHQIPHSSTISWVLLFVTITANCFNWATNVDMLLAVVIPSRRNAANSWQILISHLFGDASGPYVVGLISDAVRGDDDSPAGHFYSLVASFYLPNVLLIVSATLFLIAAYTFVRDQKIFQKDMGVLSKTSVSTSVYTSEASHAHHNNAYVAQEAEETTKV